METGLETAAIDFPVSLSLAVWPVDGDTCWRPRALLSAVARILGPSLACPSQSAQGQQQAWQQEDEKATQQLGCHQVCRQGGISMSSSSPGAAVNPWALLRGQ